MNTLERFLNYVKISTTSNFNSQTVPSTFCQKVLAKYLVNELKSIGVNDVFYDNEHCYVYALLKVYMNILL